MPNPFRRGTIRGLMIAVLVLALISTSFVYLTRRRAYASLAQLHQAEMAAMASVSKSSAHQADVWEGKAPFDPKFAFFMPVSDTRHLRQSEAEYGRRADYHAALSYKYRHAADRPWTSVEPDPPSP